MKSAKKFNWSRALPLIAIVSLVGGYLVFRSFAGTANNPYTYAVSKCVSLQKASNTCYDESAEALVYRFYAFSDSKGPDVKGFVFWSSRLKYDKKSPTEVATQLVDSSQTRSMTNKKYVNELYTRVLGKEGDVKGVDYWQRQLESKAKSRPQLLAHFANESSAKTFHRAAFKNYVTKNKEKVSEIYESHAKEMAVNSGQLAKKSQEFRKQSIKARDEVDIISSYFAGANARYSGINSLKSSLNKIKTYVNQLSSTNTTIKNQYVSKIDAYYSRSLSYTQELQQYGLNDTRMRAQVSAISSKLKIAQGEGAFIGSLLAQANADYNNAKNKIAQIEAPKSACVKSGGVFDNYGNCDCPGVPLINASPGANSSSCVKSTATPLSVSCPSGYKVTKVPHQYSAPSYTCDSSDPAVYRSKTPSVKCPSGYVARESVKYVTCNYANQ